MLAWLREWWVGILITGGIVLMLGCVIVLAIDDQRRWVAFSATHHCKVVGKMAPQTAVGFAGGKTVVTTTSGQTGFLCDDGVTYWRSE